MSSKKLITTWEKEKGLILLNVKDPSQKISEEDFNDILAQGMQSHIGVNHEDRIKFLKDNGHEVTRENMINGFLTIKSLESDNININDEPSSVE